ncbi:MAG: STAS domain-containing protein, partial [Ignavibacteriales bacterium]|nr:STAS domain-containing protein [Ignavibacteriales bacterium]
MHVDIKRNGAAAILKLKERRLDANVSPELKGEFLVICTPQTRELIVDLSEVEFCDS